MICINPPMVQAPILDTDSYSWLVGIGLLLSDVVVFVFSTYAQFLAIGNDTRLQRAANLSRSGVARPNPERDYHYLRVSQKEPFDILYFTPALTLIANANDRSLSIAPEVLYTGINNLELRARFPVCLSVRGRSSESG